MEIIFDRYDGVIIDTKTLPPNKTDFKSEIERLIRSYDNKKLIWISVPIDKSNYIPILTNLNFEFHHCDEKNLVLCKKITSDAFVPKTKNFIVGIGAIVISEGQLLVVKDRFSNEYKLPGGHIDKNESIINAVIREVHEETGIKIEFESIMNIGHFRSGQFGESNLYFVCTAKALSKNISINDSSEISEARWIAIDDFLNSDNISNYNRNVVEAAINNKELKLTEKKIKLRTANGEVFL